MSFPGYDLFQFSCLTVVKVIISSIDGGYYPLDSYRYGSSVVKSSIVNFIWQSRFLNFIPLNTSLFFRILTRLAMLMSAAAIVLFSAGCDPDTPGGGGGGGVTLRSPVISLNSGTDLITFNQERALSNPTFMVKMEMRISVTFLF
jgi:hypothetical protein